jgi:hypothetical protein
LSQQEVRPSIHSKAGLRLSLKWTLLLTPHPDPLQLLHPSLRGLARLHILSFSHFQVGDVINVAAVTSLANEASSRVR